MRLSPSSSLAATAMASTIVMKTVQKAFLKSNVRLFRDTISKINHLFSPFGSNTNLFRQNTPLDIVLEVV